MFLDREHVWWIVPAGQQLRHAITNHPGSRPAGDLVTALCSAMVKLPYETWPASREPASRRITARCPNCQTEVADRQETVEGLIVSTWDS
ncbi:hypothetical protein [Haloactinomyces albus]|uniref:Uncharacterized protein n=1 Tax=Haloactinomyces albus TaxID=1352928 RepID=A0AAE4CKT0_9ACTN|nr:hypothetical protein [Haloactinomyces albus]MDR7301074.1 hypothetical protein [Haloactinomyces albus]